MGKYFWGNPAYYSNRANERIRKEKQALKEEEKQRSIWFIKAMLADGVDIDDFYVQIEMQYNNITLDDLGITEANDYQETKKFDYGR